MDGNLDGNARPDMGADEVAPFTVFANSIETIVGEYFTGDLADISGSDDQRYSSFCDSVTLRTVMEIRGMAPQAAGRVQVRLEISADRAGLALNVTAYDYNSGVWRTAGGSVTPTVDGAFQFLAPSIGTYVGPGGTCKAQISTVPINDEDPSQDGWLTNLDRWEWVMVP